MLWTRSAVIALAALVLASLIPPRPAIAGETHRCVLHVELDGIVNSGTAGYVADAVAHAENGPCQALLLTVDTPGGSLEATRTMTKALLGARIPVITYVTPRGARAGSAGMFVVMAAHVAAMAPGTNIGAAHPVVGLGRDPEETGEHAARKIENDTAAFARAIAEERGRNAAWAERAVRESVSATATEALETGVIDHVARSTGALLESIDGTTVAIGDTERRLDTASAGLRSFDMSIQQRALAFLGTPNIAYLLFMIGIIGLALEFYNPGMFVPGTVGLFSLILGAIGMEMLPVWPGAIALLIGAGVLFVTELFVASYGLLTLGGVIALIIGSTLLIDRDAPDFFADPSVELSFGFIAPLVVTVTAVAITLAWLLARSHRRRPTIGREALVGETGEALSDIDGSGGSVRVHGERWQATADRPVNVGQRARVTGSRGLTLEVTPIRDKGGN